MRTCLASLGALMLLSAGCVIAVVDRSSDGRPWPVSSEFRKTLDLASGGVVTLDNADGDIEISGWENKRVDIRAYRSRELPASAGIYFLGRRFSPPDVTTEMSGDKVTIKTGSGRKNNNGGIVDYVLKVPRPIRLDRIRNRHGDIDISDVYGRVVVIAEEGNVTVANSSGSLDIRLERGSVEAELLDLRPGDGIRIEAGRGDITLFLEPGVAASFSLQAPAGTISSEIDLGQPLPAGTVSAITGEGGATLAVTTLQGNIRIRKVEGT